MAFHKSADNNNIAIDMMMEDESRRSSLQSIQTRKTTNSSRKMMPNFDDGDSAGSGDDCCSNGSCGAPSSRSSMKDDSAPLRPCRRVSAVTLLKDATFDEDGCSDADYSDSSEYDSDSDSEDEDEGPCLEDLGYGAVDIPTSKDLGYGDESSTQLDASAATLTSRGGSDFIPAKPVKRMSANKPLRNNFSIYGGALGSDSDYTDDSDYSISDSEEDEYDDDFFGEDDDLTPPPPPPVSSSTTTSMMNTPRRISMDYGYQEDNPSLPTRVDIQFGAESDHVPRRISLQFNNSHSNSLMDSSDRSNGGGLRNGRLEVSIGTSGLKRQAESGRLSLSHTTSASSLQLQQQQQQQQQISPIPLPKPSLTRGTTIDLGSLAANHHHQQQPATTAQMWNPTLDHQRNLSPREQQALRRRLSMGHNSASSGSIYSSSPQRGITRNVSSRPQRRTTMDHHHTTTPGAATPERRITRNTSSRPMRRTTMDHCSPSSSNTSDLNSSSTHSRTAPPKRGVNRYASSRPVRRTTMDHYHSNNDLNSSSSHSRTAPQSRGVNRYASSRQLPMRRTTMDHNAPSSSLINSSPSQRAMMTMMVQRSPSMSHSCSSSSMMMNTKNSMTYCDHNGRLLATDLKQISPALSNTTSTRRRISMDTSKSMLGRVHPVASHHRRERVLPQRNRSLGGRAA